MQAGVLGLVHHSHAAAAKFFEDAVMRDRLAEHKCEILRPAVGQVNEGVFAAYGQSAYQ
jgi:hypothetical protein